MLNEQLNARKESLQTEALSAQLAAETIDVTLPGRRAEAGALHPITRTIQRMETFFASMGFDVVEGPEIETTITISRRSIFLRITLRALCMTRSMLTTHTF